MEHSEEAFKAIETSVDNDAFDHLLRVTAGLESMVIGEDQVLNQVWDAYLVADKAKTIGPILKHLFNRAMTLADVSETKQASIKERFQLVQQQLN